MHEYITIVSRLELEEGRGRERNARYTWLLQHYLWCGDTCMRKCVRLQSNTRSNTLTSDLYITLPQLINCSQGDSLSCTSLHVQLSLPFENTCMYIYS